MKIFYLYNNTLLIRMDHYFWPKFAKLDPTHESDKAFHCLRELFSVLSRVQLCKYGPKIMVHSN